MNILRTLFIAVSVVVMTVSCDEKKETANIIAHKPVVKKAVAPQAMQSYDHSEDVSWIGRNYKIKIKRTSDKSLPMIVDGSGNKYYDNKISVEILREDGSGFFSRIFTKNDFSKYLDEAYMKKSALLGFVLEKAEGDNLYFSASIGSPDVLSDEYVPMRVVVSRVGGVSIEKSQRLDLSATDDDYEEDGV